MMNVELSEELRKPRTRVSRQSVSLNCLVCLVCLVEQEKLNDARHTRQRSFGMQIQFYRSLIECTIAENPF